MLCTVVKCSGTTLHTLTNTHRQLIVLHVRITSEQVTAATSLQKYVQKNVMFSAMVTWDKDDDCVGGDDDDHNDDFDDYNYNVEQT